MINLIKGYSANVNQTKQISNEIKVWHPPEKDFEVI